MLPTHLSSGGSGPPIICSQLAAAAAARRPSFVGSFCHRMVHVSLMDLQFSLAQFSLLLFSPRKVYAFAVLRKKQKNHYARDDPGFLLLLLLFSVLVGLAYGLAFSQSLCGCLLTALAPSIYLLLSGAVIAPLAHSLLKHSDSRAAPISAHHYGLSRKNTSAWKGMKPPNSGGYSSESSAGEPQAGRRDLFAQQQQPTAYFPLRLLQHAAERVPAVGAFAGAATGNSGVELEAMTKQRGKKLTGASGSSQIDTASGIEIFYCFDVHWNAAFVYMVVGLVAQLFLFPVFSMLPDFLACLLANGLQLAAAGSYLFITLLGYVSVAATPELPPLSALFPPVASAAALIVVCTAFFHINFAYASVKLLLLFESLAMKPLIKSAGIAHTLLQHDALDFFSSNSNNSVQSDARPPAVMNSVSASTSETIVEAATESAAEAAAVSTAAASVGEGEAARSNAPQQAKGTPTRGPPAYSPAVAGVPSAGGSVHL